jgi:drug/metabolite transporter (DMT)-like permease
MGRHLAMVQSRSGYDRQPMSERHDPRATAMGAIAIILWSTSVALIRTLSEQLGPFSTVAFAYLFSGAVSVAAARITPGGVEGMGRLSRRYLWGCGTLFVSYTACYCLAVGLAADRTQVLEVGLINYLWPSLTLLLSIPLLRHRARWFLLPGMLAATTGVVIATAHSGGLSPAGLWANASAHGLPYGLALVGAIAWALYSNLARRWGGEGGGVPLFLLASGLAVLPFRFVFRESSSWAPRVTVEFVYMALFVTVVAYVSWDWAMRKGDMVLVAALSYFTPLLSTLFSAAYLAVVPGPAIWVACALVIAGAAVCRLAVGEAETHPDVGREGQPRGG